MNAQDLPKNQSTEQQGDKRPANRVGVYRHEASGAELIATSSVQADAFVRLDYKYVGPAPKKGASQAAKNQKQSADATDETETLKKQLAEKEAELEKANAKAAEEAEARQKAEEAAKAAAPAKKADTPKTQTPAQTNNTNQNQ